MTDDYQEFLTTKIPADHPTGITDIPPLPSALKEFQRRCVEWGLRRGRAAMFEGTGLGKSLQQLAWARVVANHEQGKILLLTPLAVAEQTVKEADKFSIPGVAYAEDDDHITSDIVVTNYERFEKFDIEDFAGVVLDESGIIKSQDGKTRAILTDACQDVPWRLCCSATPAPNDYTELGQHSEFLGVMTAKQMLSMFFVHDGSIRANNDNDTASTDGWRLKRHAEKDFWRWLASWALVIRHPRDIGFDEPGYDLPPLNVHQITVGSSNSLIAPASTLRERITARKETADERVTAAIELINRNPDDSWLVWCNLNSEADAIEALLPAALQVAGRHPVEIKKQRLLGFVSGEPPILVSKPKIAGHGMNWQHCRKMVFVGLTDSFEQVYQATRRCWRFGQTHPVDVYFIAAEREGNVVANIKRKEESYNKMLDAMADHMRDLVRGNLMTYQKTKTIYAPNLTMELPGWLTTT